jgi:hypothetical protein
MTTRQLRIGQKLSDVLHQVSRIVEHVARDDAWGDEHAKEDVAMAHMALASLAALLEKPVLSGLTTEQFLAKLRSSDTDPCPANEPATMRPGEVA